MEATDTRFRRGTQLEHQSFTGSAAEVTVDTTRWTLVVHDGVTQGGFPVALENLSNVTNQQVRDKLGFQPAFEVVGNTIVPWTAGASTNTTGFVVGSRQFNDDGSGDTETRMLFDSVSGSFRAGRATSTQWDSRGLSTAAFGIDNTVTGNYSLATGSNNIVSGNDSFAAGRLNNWSGNRTIISGDNNTGSADDSLVIGTGNNVTGDDQWVLAVSSIVDGALQFVTGSSHSVQGQNNLVSGTGNTISGTTNMVFGANNTVSGDNNLVSGTENTSTSSDSVILGTGGISTGDGAHVWGNSVRNTSTTISWALGEQYTNDVGRSLSIAYGNNINSTTPVGIVRLEVDLDGQRKSAIYLGNSTTAPSTTQFRIYNINGQLWWNGTRLDNQSTGVTSGVYVTDGSVIRQDASQSPYATTDFVWGSNVLDDAGDTDRDARMLFDKSASAFRAGSTTGGQWDSALRGDFSAALGRNTTASGRSSWAMGENVVASGDYSAVFGDGVNTSPTPDLNDTNALAVVKGDTTGGGNHTWIKLLTDVEEDNSGLAAIEITPGNQEPAVKSNRLYNFQGNLYWNGTQLDITSGGGSSVLNYNSVNDVVTLLEANGASWSTTDFVWGSNSLDNTGDAQRANRMLFDKDRAAFRAGSATGGQWDTRGLGSAAFGQDNAVTGNYSTAFGRGLVVSGEDTVALGNAAGSGINITDNGALVVAWGDPGGTDATIKLLTRDGSNRRASIELSATGAPSSVANRLYNSGGNLFWNGIQLDAGNSNGKGVFEVSGTTVRFDPVLSAEYSNSDWVFGSPSLDDSGNSDHDSRILFDKVRYAFRAGSVAGDQWDTVNRGAGSTALGFNTQASGTGSFAAGTNVTSTSNYGVTLGQNIINSGKNSFVFGTSSVTKTVDTENSLQVFQGDDVGNDDAYVVLHTDLNQNGTRISGIELSANTLTPASTTNRLYNINGNLFWGDQQLDLSGAGGTGAFVYSGGTTSVIMDVSTNGSNYATADFVFGSNSTEDISVDATRDSRMLFDKSLASFRAGTVDSTQWNAANRGAHSVAFGKNNIASGAGSAAFGDGVRVSATNAAVFGTGNDGNAILTDNHSLAVLYGDVSNTQHTWIKLLTDADAAGGTTGKAAIEISAMPSGVTLTNTTNRLYNQNGQLFWNGSQLVGGATFEVAGDVVRMSADSGTTYTAADFVFGSDSLQDSNDATRDSRFQFDKSASAFRAGIVTGMQWDTPGADSAAFGRNNTVSGTGSFAAGSEIAVTGQHTAVFGEGYQGTAAAENHMLAVVSATNSNAKWVKLIADTDGNRRPSIFLDTSDALPTPNANSLVNVAGVLHWNGNRLALFSELGGAGPDESPFSLRTDISPNIIEVDTATSDVRFGEDAYPAAADEITSAKFMFYDASTSHLHVGSMALEENSNFRNRETFWQGVVAPYGVNSVTFGNTTRATADYSLVQGRNLFTRGTDSILVGRRDDTVNTLPSDHNSSITVFRSATATTGSSALLADTDNDGTTKASVFMTLSSSQPVISANASVNTENGIYLYALSTGLYILDTTSGSDVHARIATQDDLDTVNTNNLWENATGGVVRIKSTNTSVLTTSDWVFGSTQLNDSGNSDHDSRFLFDKDIGAWRAGIATGTQWDTRGAHSAAFGRDLSVTGEGSVAFGDLGGVSGSNSMLISGGTGAATPPALAESNALAIIKARATGTNHSWVKLLTDADGDDGFKSALEITDATTAPTVTTNRLYNLGGDLYWDGTQLGTGASDSGVFEYDAVNDLVRLDQSGGATWADTDWVWGSDSLDDDNTTTDKDARVLFDKSAGAFRAGIAQGTQWNSGNRGAGSAAFGTNNTASGNNSVAMGLNINVSGDNSLVVGNATNSGQVFSRENAITAFLGDSAGTDHGYVTLLGDVLGDGTRQSAIEFSSVGVTQPTGATNNNWLYVVDNVLYFRGEPVTLGSTSGSGMILDTTQSVNTVRQNVAGSGDYATDDWVFGSPQLDDTGIATNDSRMLFDKSRGAFRAGQAQGTQWDNVNRGNYSAAFGQNTAASGVSSAAFGEQVGVSGAWSMVVGYGNDSDVAPTMSDSTALGVVYGDTDAGTNHKWIKLRVDTDGDGTRRPSILIDDAETSPANTTNSLYNVSGNLFWNGQRLARLTDVPAATTSIWEVNAGIVRMNNASAADWATSDFVVGAPGINDTGNSSYDRRLVFDKSRGSFRVGRATGTDWDVTLTGDASFATGTDTRAAGDNSAALGNRVRVTGNSSVVIGDGGTSTDVPTLAEDGALGVVSGDSGVGTDHRWVKLLTDADADGSRKTAVEISPTPTAPATTDNRLYNTQGQLFWNGTRLDTAATVRIQADGVDIATDTITLNFRDTSGNGTGVAVQDAGNGVLDIFIPGIPLTGNFSSHYGTTDGVNDATVVDNTTTLSARISAPSGGEGTPYRAGDWAGDGSTHPSHQVSTVTFTSNARATGFGGDSAVLVEILRPQATGNDPDATTYTSHTITNITGNVQSTQNGITIDINGYVSNVNKFEAEIDVTVDLSVALATGGRYQVRITHTTDSNSDDGLDYTFTTPWRFYDLALPPITAGAPTIEVVQGNVKTLSGLSYWSATSDLEFRVPNIDNLNWLTQPDSGHIVWGDTGGSFALLEVTDDPFTNPGNFTGWTGNHDDADIIYTRQLSLQASQSYAGTGSIEATINDAFGNTTPVNTVPGLVLMDTYPLTGNSDALVENFRDEQYRQLTNSFNSGNTTFVAGNYNSAVAPRTNVRYSNGSGGYATTGVDAVTNLGSIVHPLNTRDTAGTIINDWSEYAPGNTNNPTFGASYENRNGVYLRSWFAPLALTNYSAGTLTIVGTPDDINWTQDLRNQYLQIFIRRMATNVDGATGPAHDDDNYITTVNNQPLWLHGNNTYVSAFGGWDDGLTQSNTGATVRTSSVDSDLGDGRWSTTVEFSFGGTTQRMQTGIFVEVVMAPRSGTHYTGIIESLTWQFTQA